MNYDYIIAGAGSAGCVLANRLSADARTRVLLVEAGGPDRDPLIHIPLGVGKLWAERRHDWCYDATPGPGVNDRAIQLPRGKVLGGSSSINAMVYVRGNRGDYDRWAAQGARGWSYADVLPYFKRCEAWIGGGDAYRGNAGPLGTCYADGDNPEVARMLEAGRAAGYPVSADVNGAQDEGFARTQATLIRGRRASAARTFLRAARGRSNLHVVTHAHAERVLFEGKRAVGLEYTLAGRRVRGNAAGEVILACGAINSPQLLAASGIGPRDTLERIGVPLLTDSPAVGANLQDHVQVGVVYARHAPGAFAKLLRYDRIARAMVQAHLFGTGPATRIPGGAQAFIKLTAQSPVPEIQFAFRFAAREAQPWWPWRAPAWQDSIMAFVVLLHPRSRGRVQIIARDAAPRIHSNFLADASDAHTLAGGIRALRNVFGQPILDSLRGPETAPGSSVQSDAALIDYIRSTAASFHHSAGTCRMGSDAASVVDCDLRVRGVENLRVVDASVMPDLVSGNINACVLMIAERAADMIRGAKE